MLRLTTNTICFFRIPRLFNNAFQQHSNWERKQAVSYEDVS